jgi:CHAT domain-containing protein
MKAKNNLRAIPKAQASAVLIDEAVAPGLPRLYGVKEEIVVVESLLETNGLDSSRIAHVVEGATVERVMHRLQDASIVHFACHGMENSEDPLKSGFKLRDGTLTIEKLMRLNMPKALFAFLSACETAKGNQKQPDYNVHLSAAMLFVGFRSVIGTLWCVLHLTGSSRSVVLTRIYRSMNDDDGPFVAKIVYEELCSRNALDVTDVPYALDIAVQEMRKRGLPSNRWAPFIHMGV